MDGYVKSFLDFDAEGLKAQLAAGEGRRRSCWSGFWPIATNKPTAVELRRESESMEHSATPIPS